MACSLPSRPCTFRGSLQPRHLDGGHGPCSGPLSHSCTSSLPWSPAPSLNAAPVSPPRPSPPVPSLGPYPRLLNLCPGLSRPSCVPPSQLPTLCHASSSPHVSRLPLREGGSPALPCPVPPLLHVCSTSRPQCGQMHPSPRRWLGVPSGSGPSAQPQGSAWNPSLPHPRLVP